MQTTAMSPESEKFQLAFAALLMVHPFLLPVTGCAEQSHPMRNTWHICTATESTPTNPGSQASTSPATRLQKQTQPTLDGPTRKANAGPPGSTPPAVLLSTVCRLTCLGKKPCQRSFLSADLPKQHMCSRVVSRAKERVRV